MMEEGGQWRDLEEVPLITSSDTSANQTDQLEPIEDSNPHAIEHSKEIELSGPSGQPPQVIEPSNTQEIELSGPLGGPSQAIEHSSTQEIELSGLSGGPPHVGPPHMGPPHMGPPHGGPPPVSENSNTPTSPRGNKYAVKCAAVASVASLLLGFAIGVVSEALVHVDKDKRFSERQLEFHAMILHVLSIFGSIMAGWIADRIGRRRTITWALVFLCVGSLMSFFPNNSFLLFGRAVTQVGVSFAPMIATIYIAEISPAPSRGFLASFPQLSINFGTVVGYVFNYFSSKFHPNFGGIAMLIMGIISPFLLITGTCISAESPRWLFMQGHHIDARHIFFRITNSEEEADIRLNSISEAIGMPVENNNNVQVNMQSIGEAWRDLILHPIPIVRHMLACAAGIHLLQQGCGIDTLILYSPRIFEKANITSSNQKLTLTLLIHALKAVPILIPTFCLDRVGRKRLLLTSIIGMIFGLVLLGISLTVLDNDTKPRWAVGMCIASLLICVCFYSIGMGPIPSVYSSEIFPLRLRALGNAISVGLNQCMSGVMAIIILYLYEWITLGGVAFLFMAITLFACCFVYRIMPETHEHTLEEMQQIFGTLNLWRFRVEHAAAQGEA